MTEQQFTTEELNSEEWKSVVGYEGFYEVSNIGRVRSLQYHGKPKIKLLKTRRRTARYDFVTLYRWPKAKCYFVHVLVASTFCMRKRPEQRQVNHMDSNRYNNRACNLEWNTAKEDGEHRARMGRAAKGDRHGTKVKPESVPRGSKQGCAKIDERDAEQMRIRYAEIRNYLQVAREFGVSESNAHRIIKGETWKHVLSDHLPVSNPDHKGVHNSAAKIAPETVRQIRSTYLMTGNYAEVARMFQMSESQTIRIVKRQSWAHIE